jgi:hypothetical protein
MIFRERTEYLLCTVKASGKECYKDFDVTAAWNAMLEATNSEDTVTLIIKRMSCNQARGIFYAQQQGTTEHENTTIAASDTKRYQKRRRASRHTSGSV